MITRTSASGTFYFYNKKEQSIPIVFIHGVGLTYEIWQPQLDFLKIVALSRMIFWVMEKLH